MIETRINDPSEIDVGLIKSIIDAGRTPTIQFSRPRYSAELLGDLDKVCAEFGDAVEVRFYGHYSTGFDATALAHLPNASWLSVDCLTRITNEHEIAKLTALRRFSFGVYEFDDPEFLKRLDVGNLSQLTLVQNAKRNIDLAPLRNASNLTYLFVNGFTKNIDALSTLSRLEELTLSGIGKRQDLTFVSSIIRLRSLELILGGRQSIDEVAHPLLERLSIIRVRGFDHLGPTTRFPRLRSLRVEDQLQLKSLELGGSSIERLVLFNCKNLESVSGLDALSALTEFRAGQTKLDLDLLRDRPWPPTLEVLGLFSGSQKWNDATRALLAQRGFRPFPAR